LNAERNEQNYLQDQIAEFEQWQATQAYPPDGDDEQVLCPICQNADLIVTADKQIVCPAESCSFFLQATISDRPLCMMREQLRAAHEEHARNCSNLLHFENQMHGDQTTLASCCEACRLTYIIV
jgi:hypothetical protein